jgi:hypothetical protein
VPLPLFTKNLADHKIKKYCDNRVPPHVRNEVRLTHKFRGNSITIYEERVPWRKDMKEWTSHSLAQIRYDEKTGKWSLYCADRNSKWHKYYGLGPTQDLDVILNEIDKDPTGIFWG